MRHGHFKPASDLLRARVDDIQVIETVDRNRNMYRSWPLGFERPEGLMYRFGGFVRSLDRGRAIENPQHECVLIPRPNQNDVSRLQRRLRMKPEAQLMPVVVISKNDGRASSAASS